VLTELFSAGPTAGRVRAAAPALALVAVAVGVRAGLGIASGWAQARLAPQVDCLVETRLFEATTAVELSAFDDAEFSEGMDRAQSYGFACAAFMVGSAIDLLAGVVGLAGTATAVVVIQPLLLPALCVTALPAAWTAVRIARREYVSSVHRISRRRRLWMLADVMASPRTATEVRAFQLRDFLLGEYRRVMTAEVGAHLAVIRAHAGTRAIGGLFSAAATTGVYAVLGLLLVAGAVPLATAATAVLALQAAHAGLRVVVQAANRIYENSLYHLGDYVPFLERAAGRIPPPRPQWAVSGFQEITAERVGLLYAGTNRPAVRDVTIRVRRGEVIALVGENGSGKTSLAKLLAGLYRPTSGRVCWDGRDLTEIGAEQTRTHVSMITQDWWRFPFTARVNIAIGRHTRRDGDAPIHAAARAAGAHEMITALPAGYDTLLDRKFRGGQDLSGGQWQRLVAARGLYRDGILLICDEPSAALDARAEHELFQQLRRRPDRAVILITHRLANIRHADRIYVMHQGRVTEEGDHDQLMATGGEYAQLFTLQAAGYLDPPG